jgi:hypothetical protein
MKIFLQDKRTGFYVAGGNEWSESSSEAFDFPNYDKAVAFAVEYGLPRVQVVLKFQDQPYRICLPFRRQLAACGVA